MPKPKSQPAPAIATEPNAIDYWLMDVGQSDIYGLQRFARTSKRDIVAVCNAMTNIWSNGQTDGRSTGSRLSNGP
jgi:transposase